MILNSPYITGSITVTGNANIQGQLTVTGSLSGTAATASFALTLGGTGSVGFATTGAFTAASGSASSRLTQIEQVYATTGSNSFRATQSITGSLTVTGQIIAQTINVQQVTSSIVYSSGSNTFGCDLNSRQTFTGSFYQTGSVAIFNSCVGIGTVSPSYQLDMCSGATVNQRIRLQRGSDDTNQNMLLGWNNIVLTRSNLTIASNQTDFSIIQCGCDGIRTPFYIDVLGRTCFACTAMIGNTGCYYELGNDAGGGFIENHGSTAAKSAFRIQTSKCNDTTNYAQFIINPYCGFAFMALNGGNGNVGIGVTNPSVRLDILGNNEVMNIAGCNSVSAFTGYYYNTSTLVGYIGNGSSILTGAASSDFIFRSQGALVYATCGNNERMRINSSGYIGIGTCSPSSKLTIIRDSPFNTGDQAFRIRACNSDGYNLWMGASTSGYATIQSYQDNVGGAPLSLNPLNGGNVGIGTISPNSRLEVQKTGASAPGIFINQCSSDEATIRFKSTHSGMSDFRIGASILVGNAFEIYNVQCNRTNYMVNCNGFSKMSPDGTFVNGNNTAYHSMDGTSDVVLYSYNRSAVGNGILSNVQPCSTNYYAFRAYSDPYGDMAFIYSNGTFGSRTGTYGAIISDVRCKTEIVDASSQWSDIKNLRVRNFKLIEDVEKDPTNALRQIGFIAQEVECVSPNLVFEAGNGCVDTEPWKNVKSSIIHTKAVKALQEAMCRIEILESCLGIS